MSRQVDPYISPGLVSPDVLSRWPPTRILVGDLDPTLDDSVLFASNLRKVIVHVRLGLNYNTTVWTISCIEDLQEYSGA